MPNELPFRRLLPLFLIWNRDELQQAVGSVTRACQARWSAVAVVLVLWQWGLRNRQEPFTAIVDKLWGMLVGTMDSMGESIREEPVTPAALCKARKGIGTAAFEHLHQTATEKHQQRHTDLILHNRYRLYAVDGSTLKLHANKPLTAVFGRPSSNGKRRSPPQATFTVLELVNTGWIVDYRLGRCDEAELHQSKSLSAGLGPGDLLLADRLYFDPQWYTDLSGRGVKFLFRLNCNRYESLTPESQRRIEQQRATGNVDCTVELRVKAGNGRPACTLNGLRYIEIKRDGVQTLYFITNLRPDELATLEAADLYRMRWEIETNLRYFKGQDHLPAVRSRREDTVRQEVLLHVLAHNSVRFIQSEACLDQLSSTRQDSDQPTESEVSENPPEDTAKWLPKTHLYAGPLRPIDLQFNRTVDTMLGTILDQLINQAHRTPERWRAMLRRVAALRILAKPGRSYPRRGRKFNKGKRNKGNTKAQKKRARGRSKAARTRNPRPKAES
jgi:hypothetical protein